MTISLQETAALLKSVRLNPSASQRVLLEACQKATQGQYDIVSATNPFMFLLSANVMTSVNEISSHQDVLRVMYPELAVDPADVYRHMSDQDYIGTFATPGRTVIRVAMSRAEILSKAVRVDDTGIRKLVLARNTQVRVADYVFTMQYPIEIRVMSHGGLSIVYNADYPSPLYPLNTNVVDWEQAKTQDYGDMIILDIPMYQFQIEPHYAPLNVAAGFRAQYTFQNRFYFCRVYQSTDGKVWKELQTTHSQQVYDASTPTACLRVTDQVLDVEVPQVYFNNGLVSGQLRVEVYTTLGEINVMLDQFEPNAFTATWQDFASKEDDKYIAPLEQIKQMTILSEQLATGGSNGIDFDELRSRNIYNANNAKSPKTLPQLQVAMADRGYSLVQNVDYVTDRIFLATRVLPKPEGTELSSGANSSIDLVEMRFADLVTLETVRDNGERVTVLPGTLYRLVDGKVRLVEQGEVAELQNANRELLANLVNSRSYMFSPYHYVLDATENKFRLRGYYLQEPKVLSRHFEEENDTAETEVSTGEFRIEKTAAGFDLFLVTRSGESYQQLDDRQVHCQLSFLPQRETTLAFLNGELYGKKGKERVFRFRITTNYDFNSNHHIGLTSFGMFGNQASLFLAQLTQTMNIVHSVSGARLSTYKSGAIDLISGDDYLPDDRMCVIHETVVLEFGKALRYLWSNSRTVVSENDYLLYEENVPMLYPETQWERDPKTGTIVLYPNGSGGYDGKVLHEKGDPVLVDGEPKMAHYKGEVKLDQNGRPILKNPRGLVRQCELFFLEGVFRFSTDQADVAYRNGVAGLVVNYLENDIGAFSQELLENTAMYFAPKRTLGEVIVLGINNSPVRIPTNLAFRVRFQLREDMFNNMAFRDSLERTTRIIIANALKKDSVSLSALNDDLRGELGNDRVPVDIWFQGLPAELTAFTMRDDSARCSVRRKLTVQPDDTLRVQDDISFEWTVQGR